MPIPRKVNKDFFKTWTPEMAYVLGFFAADGNILKNKRGGHYLSFHSADKNILSAIQKAMGSNHKLSKRVSDTGKVYRFQIGSKEMFNDLNNLDFTPHKAHRVTLPNIPPQFVGDFLRGYFDGDGNVWVGYINKKRDKPTHVLQASFTSGSVGFLQELKSLLHKNGIEGGYIYSSKTKDFSRLTLSTLDALKLYKIMYNDADKHIPLLLLKRKKLVFEKFKNMRP